MLVTTGAIIVAGLWTYRLFVRKRIAHARVNLSLESVDRQDDMGWRLIHIKINVENVGNVILRADAAELRVRQVLPFPDSIQQSIHLGDDPVSPGRTEVEWPLISVRKWKWDEGLFEVEPGESDSLHADFIVPDHVVAVEYYVFIANESKKKISLGWTLTEVAELAAPVFRPQAIGRYQNGWQQQQQQQQQQQPTHRQFLGTRPREDSE